MPDKAVKLELLSRIQFKTEDISKKARQNKEINCSNLNTETGQN